MVKLTQYGYYGLFFLMLGMLSCSDLSEDVESDQDQQSNGLIFGNDNKKNTINFKTQSLTPLEYVKWVKSSESGLVKVKTINDLKFSMYHLPTAYMICNDAKDEKLTQQKVVSLALQYQDYEYYMLRIEAPQFNQEFVKYQVSSPTEYEKRIEYYAFSMQHDIVLETENMTIPCEIFHFERIYNIAPYSTFLLGFPKELMEDTKERTLVFNEKVFNKGIVKFRWLSTELDNIPQIAI